MPLLLLKGSLAYLDPGSGSYLLQLLIAGILGAIFVFRGYLARLKDFIVGFARRTPQEEDSETGPNSS